MPTLTYTKVAIMRRVHIFLFVLTASLGLLVVLFAASLYLATAAPTPYQSSWMQQMWRGMGMNGMMGGTGYNGYSGYAAPSYLWIIPAGLIGFVAIGIIGLAFYMAFPEIRPTTTFHETGKRDAVSGGLLKDPVAETISPSAPRNPYESVSKTLTAEERKVLDVLVTHQGRYLQKYIRKEAGLSRLKTHRIIARFAERGIVTLKQSGNTNEVVLSDWLKDSKPLNSA